MIKTNRALFDYLTNLVDSRKPSSSGSKRAIQIKHVGKGERLIWQGDTPKAAFGIISGIVKCFITEENGRDYLLEFLGEGELVGELEILTQSDSISNIETLTEVQVLRIDLPFFQELLITDAAFNQLIMRELAVRLIRTASRASFQQTYPVEYAMMKILYLFSAYKETITKQDLADYLAITVRSLNRLLKQLKQEHFIQETSEGLRISEDRMPQALQAGWHEALSG